MATKTSLIRSSPVSTSGQLTEQRLMAALRNVPRRQQTRAQALNWEYGGAQGNMQLAKQCIMNVRRAIRRAGCSAVVDAGLAFEEQKVLHALAEYARKIDMHYVIEKSVHQGKRRKAKGDFK